MLQNPYELQYMTTCVQGDNVKLKMVVDCGRLLFVGVVMQKQCLKCPPAFEGMIFQRNAR